MSTGIEEAFGFDLSSLGNVPSSLTFWMYDSFLAGSGFEAGDILKCYRYNETTKLYEQVEDAEMISNRELKLNVDHCSKYIVSKTELPEELVSKATDNEINQGGEAELFIETEVNSVTWTEEDINSVLKSIEEARNNTTYKKLYVHVPSGSRVPAKIFEVASGIDITIISEDGIHAYFTGESYKAIDYVAGGTISKKAIDGMVSVGEDNILYISLKHEGELPALCNLTYYSGMTEVLQAMRPLDIEAKLYYFNEQLQKYQVCGVGHLASFADDCFEFNIDHCSSYVIAEEELPKEFVDYTGTGEFNEEAQEEPKQEEVKKEESKKEENKKDETTAPGKIPHAGGTTVIIISAIVIAIIGTISYIKNRELKGI